MKDVSFGTGAAPLDACGQRTPVVPGEPRKKPVLLLDRNGALHARLPEVQLPEWEFQSTSSVPGALQRLDVDGAAVGIIVIDTAGGADGHDVQALVSRPDVEWVAVLPPALLDDPATAEFVTTAFFDFCALPLDDNILGLILERAYNKALIKRRFADKLQPVGKYGMVGCSPPMLELYRQIDKVVKVDASVLIGGESGTGKELVARCIHRHSSRGEGPFVAINCAAIPHNLIQSELFGYERGAFTGATQRQIGSIESAHGGVIFLDEIGDLPLELQANLLRFLQEKAIVRVGSTRHIPVDVRVIAATHVDLQKAVAAGRFREDLYYRLNVLHLRVPPLRERAADIRLLADTVFRDFAPRARAEVKGFRTEAYRAMETHHWPGNVRELINRVHQAMIMSESRLIGAADLGLVSVAPAEAVQTLDEARASLDRTLIASSLRRNQNNLSQVARQLGVSRVTLYRLIDRLKIVPT